MKFISRNFRTSIIATALLNAVTDTAVGGAAPAEAKPTLTPAQKRAARVEVLTKRIADDTAALAALKQEIETAERLASVTTGTAIIAKVGRAETAREVAARVLGVKDDDNGSRRYKITFGEGFDADTVIIQPTQIVSVIAEEVKTEPVLTTDEYGRLIDGDGNVIG